MIDFRCPICGRQFSVSDDNAGKVGKCPSCGERIRVPGVVPDRRTEPPPPDQCSEPVSGYGGATRAKGINGTLELRDTTVRINRRGLMAVLTQGFKGEKEILLSEISAVQFKKGGPLFNGYIQLTFRGGQETKTGLFGAVDDENTVMFRTSQN